MMSFESGYESCMSLFFCSLRSEGSHLLLIEFLHFVANDVFMYLLEHLSFNRLVFLLNGFTVSVKHKAIVVFPTQSEKTPVT